MGYKANITSNLINQIIRILVGLVTAIAVARALGPVGQGYAAYAILIFTLIGAYGHFGLNNSVNYFRKRVGVDGQHLYNVNITALTLIFLIIALAITALKASGLIMADYPTLYIIGGLVFVLADFLFTIHNLWFVGDERIVLSNRLGILVFLLKSALILILWWEILLSPPTFFLITCAAMLLNALLLMWRLGMRWRPRLDFPLLKAEFRYGGVVYLGAVFAFLHYRVDQVMIRHMLGVGELGIYTVSVNIAELLFLIPASVTTALTGRLFNTADDGSGKRVTALTVKLTLYVCVGLALIGIPASLLIPLLYGKAFATAVSSTMILLGGVVLASVAKVSAPWYFTTGRPGAHLLITFVTLLINGGLNYLLIPRMGISGAALASSVSYALYGSYYMFLFIRKEGFTLAEIMLLTRRDITQLLGPKHED